MKCDHTKGCEKAGYRYHCYGCNHVESATANPLFHKVKFGLQKYPSHQLHIASQTDYVY